LWNTAPVTKAWVNAYDSVNNQLLYDFGDASGCPPAATCDNGWTQDDIWYISWGVVPGRPLPQIYATSGINARQWEQIALYSVTNKSTRMDFQGALTQYQACQQVGGCSGTNNTAEQGWIFLLNE